MRQWKSFAIAVGLVWCVAANVAGAQGWVTEPTAETTTPITAKATSAVASAAELPEDPGCVLQQAQAATAAAAVQDRSAEIVGEVTDVHGGLVPGASVTLERAGSHSELREATTDGTGHYRFRNLLQGAYTLLVSAPELQTYVSPPVALQEGQHLELAAIALTIASTTTTVNVSANSTAVAEQELDRETRQRVLGVFPNFYTSFVYDAAPLNTRQKFKLTTRSAIDPVAFVGIAVVAGIEQERDTFPGWGNSDAASYGKRYAAAFGDELLTRFFSYAIYPSLFHQDPRYFYMGPTYSTRTRFWHAALSGIVTRGDNGHQQPNYSHMLGSASAGALSSVYHPASDSAGYLAALNFGVGLGSKGLQALVREFILPRFTTHVPKYGKLPPAVAAAPATASATPAGSAKP